MSDIKTDCRSQETITVNGQRKQEGVSQEDENDKNDDDVDDDGNALALFLPPTESADEHLR